MQIRQCCQQVDFAMVFGYATEPGLSKATMLLDDTKWVLNLGPDMRLSRLY